MLLVSKLGDREELERIFAIRRRFEATSGSNAVVKAQQYRNSVADEKKSVWLHAFSLGENGVVENESCAGATHPRTWTSPFMGISKCK